MLIVWTCFGDFAEENELSEAETEINLYLQAGKLNCSDTDDDKELLTFWKEKSNLYPNLSRLAQKVFMVPATSVASESNFSSASFTGYSRRTNLSEEKIVLEYPMQATTLQWGEKRQRKWRHQWAHIPSAWQKWLNRNENALPEIKKKRFIIQIFFIDWLHLSNSRILSYRDQSLLPSVGYH